MALARILASKPKVILLDEPFSALDGYLKWSLESELSELLSDFQGPIVWVSHDLGECRRNCERVCVMENGTSGALMPLQTLVSHPDSISAARLCGHKNFVTACKDASGCAVISDWKLQLPNVKLSNAEAVICVPQSAIAFSEGGEIWCVRRVIEDVSQTIVLLAPENAPDAQILLRAELPLGQAPKAGERIHVSLREEALLVY